MPSNALYLKAPHLYCFARVSSLVFVFEDVIPAVLVVAGVSLQRTMPEMIALSAMQADEYETCICESIEQQIEFELIQLLKSDIGMRKCKRCGKYFIMKGNYDTNYCDRIAEGETRNCQDLAAQENYKKKMADNAAIPLYQKYYKRYAARVRVRQIKEPDFKKWKYQAMTKRDECSDGKITLAEFEEWLEGSFPNRKKKE